METIDSLLPDNSLSDVISFLDYKSAVRLTMATSKTLSIRISTQESFYRHLWRDSFFRHGFSPPEDDKKIDYKIECRRRLQLFRNLMKGSKGGLSYFNLPNRYFYFVPVTPSENEYDDEIYTPPPPPPPVDFECFSFVLTSPGTSGEMLFLDPFDGSFVLQESCTDNAVATDEAMMEQAMTDAATVIRQRETLGLESLREEHIAGAVIEESVFRNNNIEHYQRDPSQVLMDLEDYLNINLSEYFFLGRNHDNEEHHSMTNNVVLRDNDEVEVNFLGIDAKPILVDGVMIGTMAAISRSFCCNSRGWEEPKVCSEIITWKRSINSRNFGKRSVCRFRSVFKKFELDPVFERIYVMFPFNEGPFRRFDLPFLNEETNHVGFIGGSCIVAAYSLQTYLNISHDEDYRQKKEEPKYFLNPDFVLRCSNPVSAVNVLPGGEIVLIGTVTGDLEIWKTGSPADVSRINVLNVNFLLNEKFGTNLFLKSISSEVNMRTEETLHGQNNRVDLPPTDSVIEGEDIETSGISHPVSMTISSFHFAAHRTIDEVGFVTLHYTYGKGAWLFIWKKCKWNKFEICATINLPLSPRQKPRIHFDGRRLIVCGQDHIGMILLIYYVLNSWEDLDSFTAVNQKTGDGGVTDGEVVKFVNCVRHGGLGGFAFYDSFYMTANERYVVVNTKTGHMLGGGATPGTDGLLVIDLQDHIA